MAPASPSGKRSARMPLFLALFLAASQPSAPPAPASGEAQGEYLVQCAAGRSFRFTATSRQASIDYDGHRIILARTDMPLGTYFRGKEGALIIDGAFVAFVPRGDDAWRDCQIIA